MNAVNNLGQQILDLARGNAIRTEIALTFLKDIRDRILEAKPAIADPHFQQIQGWNQGDMQTQLPMYQGPIHPQFGVE